MRNLIIALLLIGSSSLSFGQSETIQKLHKVYDDAFVMFFYKNTLNMLNMQDNKEFQALIDGIDKMKLLRINKAENDFTKDQYKQLVKDYRSEDFEELMTVRQQEMNINAYIKESGGTTKGIVVLLNEAENLTVLDIKGSVPLDKIGELAKYASDFSDSKLKFD
jgi:hypothetical protein